MVGAAGEAMSFGAAVELAVAMPLSWLPLISDYTREAAKAHPGHLGQRHGLRRWCPAGCTSSAWGPPCSPGSMTSPSSWSRRAWAWPRLVILVFSTVTTTFLDAWSAGISAESLSAQAGREKDGHRRDRRGRRWGPFCSRWTTSPGFLYLIGSVFAPMIAVQIADHFILQPGPVCRCPGRRPESGHLAHRLCRLSLADGGGHPRGLHPARHGAHRGNLRYCREGQADEGVNP